MMVRFNRLEKDRNGLVGSCARAIESAAATCERPSHTPRTILSSSKAAGCLRLSIRIPFFPSSPILPLDGFQTVLRVF